MAETLEDSSRSDSGENLERSLYAGLSGDAGADRRTAHPSRQPLIEPWLADSRMLALADENSVTAAVC